jgi:alpha-glucoside transport system substrate-binding protein
MKRLTIVSLIVLFSMVLAACGGAKTPVPAPTAVPQAAPATEVPQAAPPTAAPKPTEAPKAAEPYVGFVPPALTSPFHVAMVDGATAKAKELGYKIDVQAPASEGDFQAFVTTVQQLLEKGVQIMSINPIGTDSAVTAVKAANEKGVPILAHNFITPFSEGKVESYIGYDQWGGAEKLAKTTCELIAKKYGSTPEMTKGKVFILLGIDSIFSHRRTGGFKAGLTKYCPNVVVAGEQTAEWLRTKGSEVATIAWQKDPDIDVFYGNSDEMAIGAALAGEQLGKTINKDFFAVGIDGNQPTLDLLGQGKFSATLGVDPVRMGETVVSTMQKILAGEKVPEIILTPSVVVTPENLPDYLAGKLWTEPVAGAPETDNNMPTVPEAEGGAAPVAAATGAGFSAEGATAAGLTCLADAYNGKVKGTKVTMSGPFTDEDAVKFDSAMKEFEAATGIDIQYEGSKEFEASISARIQAGDAPDIIDFPQPGLLGTFAKQGKIVPATKLVPIDWLKQNYNQSWLDMATLPGPDGKPDQFGVWERFNGKSLVWYPKKAFDDAGYKVPTTWEELQALQDQIVADGDTPWCIGIESGAATGWPATDWTEDIMLRTTSLENYDKWVKGELKFDSPEVKKAIETFANTWNNDKMVYGGKAKIVTTFFGDAPTPMFEDPPKCWLHRQGNFITSFFPAGSEPGVTYDVFYLPGIDPQYGKPFLVAGDIMAATNERPETCAVMQFFSTGAGVKGWVAAGGALAMQNDSQLDWYGDPIEKKIAGLVKEATAFRFDASDLMPGAVGAGSFWKGMTDYFSGAADLNTVVKEIDAAWPK